VVEDEAGGGDVGAERRYTITLRPAPRSCRDYASEKLANCSIEMTKSGIPHEPSKLRASNHWKLRLTYDITR
jgi:hypothetical protein